MVPERKDRVQRNEVKTARIKDGQRDAIRTIKEDPTKMEKAKNCPNCGAPADGSGRCPYCGTVYEERQRYLLIQAEEQVTEIEQLYAEDRVYCEVRRIPPKITTGW